MSSYVNMVSATLRNTIPKAVVHCQAREAKQSLLNHFYTQIGKKEGKQLSQMLDEDPALMERRQQCAKKFELYKAARDMRLIVYHGFDKMHIRRCPALMSHFKFGLLLMNRGLISLFCFVVQFLLHPCWTSFVFVELEMSCYI